MVISRASPRPAAVMIFEPDADGQGQLILLSMLLILPPTPRDHGIALHCLCASYASDFMPASRYTPPRLSQPLPLLSRLTRSPRPTAGPPVAAAELLRASAAISLKISPYGWRFLPLRGAAVGAEVSAEIIISRFTDGFGISRSALAMPCLQRRRGLQASLVFRPARPA